MLRRPVAILFLPWSLRGLVGLLPLASGGCLPLADLVACDDDSECEPPLMCSAAGFCIEPVVDDSQPDAGQGRDAGPTDGGRADGGPVSTDGGDAGLLDGGDLDGGCVWIYVDALDAASPFDVIPADASAVRVCPEPPARAPAETGRPDDAGPPGGPFPDAGSPGLLDDGRPPGAIPTFPPPEPPPATDDDAGVSDGRS